MENKNSKIDYTEKIRNFQAMVDNYNEEIAYNYLSKSEWDEGVRKIEIIIFLIFNY
jgi:hypothetical protein